MKRAGRSERASARRGADVAGRSRKDATAFEAFFDRHGGAAYSLAHRIVGDRDAAEDVAQEAFLSIWRSRAGYDRARGSVRAWVLGIVRNRAIDALRRDARPGVPQLDFDDDAVLEAGRAEERTDAEAVRRETAREVRGALADLPNDQSKVIQLAYFGGFSHSEIAEMLEHAARDREGADAPRAGEDARTDGGTAMSEMTEKTEHPSDDLAAYALGALEPAEEASVREHLDRCERCRAELKWLEPAVDVLPASVPQIEPPRGLKRDLMKTVRADVRAERGGLVGRGGASWIGLHARPALAVAAVAHRWSPAIAGYAINAANQVRRTAITARVQADDARRDRSQTATRRRLTVAGMNSADEARLPALVPGRVRRRAGGGLHRRRGEDGRGRPRRDPVGRRRGPRHRGVRAGAAAARAARSAERHRLAEPQPAPLDWRPVATCYRHPDRETAVSCSMCARPICPDCMTSTPSGCAARSAPAEKTRVATGPSATVAGPPYVTYALIALNVVAFLSCSTGDRRGPARRRRHGHGRDESASTASATAASAGHDAVVVTTAASSTGSSPAASCTPASSTSGSTCSSSTSSAACSSPAIGGVAARRRSTSCRSSAVPSARCCSTPIGSPSAPPARSSA